MKHCTVNEQWHNHLLFKSITNEIWFYNLIAQPTTYLRKCWFWLDQSSSVTEQLSLIFRETPRAAPGLTTWTRLSGLWRLRGRWAPGRGTCWCSPTSWCTAATATPRTGETWDMRPWHGDMSCVTRERRMFLIQVAAGEDSPTSDIHRLASYVQVLASCLNAKCLQIALCWHGIKRNQQGPTRRSGQKTWKLKKWGLRLYIVRKCMQQCTFWSPIDMTLIMQLEIFIDNENKFIYSKNLISQLLIILSPLQHCSKQQSSLHADARPAATCEAF